MSFTYSFHPVTDGYTLSIYKTEYVYYDHYWYRKNGSSYKKLDRSIPLWGCFIPGNGYYLSSSIRQADFDMNPYRIGGEYFLKEYNFLKEKYDGIAWDTSDGPCFHDPPPLCHIEPPQIPEFNQKTAHFGFFFVFSSLLSLLTAIINHSSDLHSRLLYFLSVILLFLSVSFLIPHVRRKHIQKKYQKKIVKFNKEREDNFNSYLYNRKRTFREYCRLKEQCHLKSSLSDGKEASESFSEEIYLPDDACSFLSPVFREEFKLRFCMEGDTGRNRYRDLSVLNAVSDCDERSELPEVLRRRSFEFPSVPVMADHEQDCLLNISEEEHGPHLLIAGTTGSGKSEFLTSLLLSWMSLYSPKEITFCLIDCKGGATALPFKDFPHIAGICSNLDERSLKRCVLSLKRELIRREELFGLIAEEQMMHSLTYSSYKRLWEKGRVDTFIPLLIVIVDEFAELKEQYPSYLKLLISIARIGRSLGIHLILSTQKIGGVVDREIRLNTNTKVLFKVLSENESYETIGDSSAYKLKAAGEMMIFHEKDLSLQKGRGFYVSGNRSLKGRIYDDTGRIVYEKMCEKRSSFEILKERILKTEYMPAEKLWQDTYHFREDSGEIFAVEDTDNNEFKAFCMNELIGGSMLVEALEDNVIKELLKLFSKYAGSAVSYEEYASDKDGANMRLIYSFDKHFFETGERQEANERERFVKAPGDHKFFILFLTSTGSLSSYQKKEFQWHVRQDQDGNFIFGRNLLHFHFQEVI